jgi:hypothetical protein
MPTIGPGRLYQGAPPFFFFADGFGQDAFQRDFESAAVVFSNPAGES